MTTSDSSIARIEMQERIDTLGKAISGYLTNNVREAEENLQRALTAREDAVARLDSWVTEVAKIDGPNVMASRD